MLQSRHAAARAAQTAPTLLRPAGISVLFFRAVILRCSCDRRKPSIAPCLPRPAKELPVGPGWIHEIKHDGFRILVQRRGRSSFRLLTRNGYDLADRFPLAAAAIEKWVVASRMAMTLWISRTVRRNCLGSRWAATL